MAENLGYNDMMRMQSEAVQRVREMQRRAQNAVQRTNVQRTGRVQESPQNKGEVFKNSASPSIQQNAKSTALPLDYISNQPPAPLRTSPPPPAPQAEKREQSAKKNDAESKLILSDNLDRLLVVTLILLLSQEEADELLLMALGYLIM